MELIKKYDGNTIIVLLTAQIGYSTINVCKHDGSVVFHPGINENFNCFEKRVWEPMDMFIVATGTEAQQGIKLQDIVLGRCNNIASMELEPMQVTGITPASKSICCAGIWTDGSAMKLVSSNVSAYNDKMGKPLQFDYRDMGGDEKFHLLYDEEIRTYLNFLNNKVKI